MCNVMQKCMYTKRFIRRNNASLAKLKSGLLSPRIGSGDLSTAYPHSEGPSTAEVGAV